MKIATVSKSIEMDTGHRVPAHASKCKNPHGHRYRITAHVTGPVHHPTGASDDGMVVDFGAVKDVLTRHVHDVFDHAFMIWAEDTECRRAMEGHGWKLVIVPFVPTAECLAEHVYRVVAQQLEHPLVLLRVDVHETPTCVASYDGADFALLGLAGEATA